MSVNKLVRGLIGLMLGAAVVTSWLAAVSRLGQNSHHISLKTAHRSVAAGIVAVGMSVAIRLGEADHPPWFAAGLKSSRVCVVHSCLHSYLFRFVDRLRRCFERRYEEHYGPRLCFICRLAYDRCQISSGESSAVSMQRRHPCRCSADTGGNSNVSDPNRR
jgi:hypothetical protein